MRVGIQEDEPISDEPVLQILGQLRQRLQHLGRHGGERDGVGVAGVDGELDARTGFSSMIDDFNCLPSGPPKTVASRRLMTGCASGVKMSPGFAVARFFCTSFSKARWFWSICWGVASFGTAGSVRSSFW